jgi:hypothetical protein
MGYDATAEDTVADAGSPGEADAQQTLSAPTYEWSAHPTGLGSQIISGIAVAANGDVVVAGHTDSAVDFGDGPQNTGGGIDAFVARYDAAGTPLWSRVFGGSDDDYAYDVAVDPDGNVYTTGIFRGTLNLGSDVLVANNNGDGFVVSYDANGSYRWATNFGDPVNGDIGFGLEYINGGLLLTGWFNGTADFGSGPVVSNSQDAVIARFTPTGQLDWLNTITGDNIEQGQKIAASSDGSYAVVGLYVGTVELADGMSTSVGGRDIFVTKYSAAGTPLWSRAAGSPGTDDGSEIAMDEAGGVLIGGRFENTIALGGEALTASGSTDAFVISYDAAGNPRWSHSIGGQGDDNLGSVLPSPDGSIVIGGSVADNYVLDGQAFFAEGGTDCFVAVLGDDGSLLHHLNFGGQYGDSMRDMRVDSDGSIFVAGTLSGDVTLGETSFQTNSADAFLLKLSRTPE